MKGRSLELYLVDGRPEGMVVAEVFNWTGHVLAFPRTRLAEALGRPEARRTGVYILLGERDGLPTGYVGESEDIPTRFRMHEQAREWWTQAVIVTTASHSLNKAHIRYLEARLVEEAKAAGSRLDNGNSGAKGSLTEAAVANMEAFLDTLLMVLPVLRIDLFTRPATPAAVAMAEGSDRPADAVFILTNPKRGVSGEAVWTDGSLVVRAGSAGHAWTGQGAPGYEALYMKLVAAGVLAVEGDRTRFTTDYAFTSPSAAAAVLQGRSANGQIEWRMKGSSQTYGEWERARLMKEAAE
ncbi:GIY-YIG nuclease family protein [Rubellimicrobium sp. CFH 75288]|uniref:GIY-YIG nuclease family protein n=1 Tax=Rubellimicrobium sp. CFH 75288 TaxID=2697034 RepID=UPI001412ED60|nr:GIY-YIG nuclease family protein [Rubellimicrobium sp. CFH 75288]NAZ38140.1 DUF4357 domain-containing protein [Rubellimicrobium sp. CFH 75288]